MPKTPKQKTARVLVLNGPNLNMLGTREPEIYGAETLAAIAKRCRARAAELGVSVQFRQTNSEGELIGWIQEARGAADALIVNAGGLSHTSIAVLDALNAVQTPIFEVHLSNIFRREDFRHTSYVSRAAQGVICGFGGNGYIMALEEAARRVKEAA